MADDILTIQPNQPLYERDVYAWTVDQAGRLRAGDLAGLDLTNLAEEIESLGTSQRSEVRSRLEVIMQHLLKWQYQASEQSRSWLSTINTQRRDLEAVLEDSPSLRRYPSEVLPRAYRRARLRALDETGLYRLPEACPFTPEQVMDTAWFPGPPSSP